MSAMTGAKGLRVAFPAIVPSRGAAPVFGLLDFRALGAALQCSQSLGVHVLDAASPRALAALAGVEGAAQGVWNWSFSSRAWPRVDLWLQHFEPITLELEGQGRS